MDSKELSEWLSAKWTPDEWTAESLADLIMSDFNVSKKGSHPCEKCKGSGSTPSFPYPERCDWCNGRGWQWNS